MEWGWRLMEVENWSCLVDESKFQYLSEFRIIKTELFHFQQIFHKKTSIIYSQVPSPSTSHSNFNDFAWNFWKLPNHSYKLYCTVFCKIKLKTAFEIGLAALMLRRIRIRTSRVNRWLTTELLLVDSSGNVRLFEH